MNSFNEEDNLIMFLPSDSNMDSHPENKISNYIVQLPKTLVFNQPMDCAISQLILPKSTNQQNLSFHLVYSYAVFPDSITQWNFDERRLLSIKIPNTNIDSHDSLCKEIIKLYQKQDLSKKFVFNLLKENLTSFDDQTFLEFIISQIYLPAKMIYDENKKILSWQRGYFKRTSEDVENAENIKIFALSWQFDDDLHKALGFSNDYKLKIVNVEPDDNARRPDKMNKIINSTAFEEIIIGKYASELFSTSQSLNEKEFKKNFPTEGNLEIFVMCDIIKESYINDVKKQYLQKTYCQLNKEATIDFEPLIYIPVSFNEINQIHIRIVDKFGEDILFEDGRIVVILLFRHRGHL